MSGYIQYIRRPVLIMLLLLAQKLSAQVYPTEGATLYSLRTAFKAERKEGVAYYMFKIAPERVEKNKLFKKRAIIEKKSVENITIMELPAFQREYSWQVEYYNEKGKNIGTSSTYHFRSVRSLADSMARKYRVRVLENRYPDSTLLFFLDYSNMLCDLKGNAIWYFPENIDNIDKQAAKNDVKASPFNTITFIGLSRGYEIDYAGNILWSTPAERTENPGLYHHDLRRLKNGNYMVLTSRVRNLAIPFSFFGLGDAGDSILKDVNFGGIVELDKYGNKVWEWEVTEQYLLNEMYYRKKMGYSFEPQMHLNAFCFDEERKMVYLGFRNINKILKLSYTGKNIVAKYNGRKDEHELVFSKQHSLFVNSDGDLCVFNNGSGGMGNFKRDGNEDMEDSIASIIVLRESEAEPGGYKKVWEFSCAIDKELPATTIRGGNFLQLADGNYFVCMGATSRVFIVNKEKEILYNAVVEQWHEQTGKWVAFDQYRAFPVTLRDIDKIIYNSVPKD